MGSLTVVGIWFTKTITAVASFNYQLVTFIFKGIESCSKLAITICSILGSACTEILKYLADILTEFGNVIYSCVKLGFKLFYLLYYIITLGVYSILFVGEAVASVLAECLKYILVCFGKIGTYLVSIMCSIKSTIADVAPDYVETVTCSLNNFYQLASSAFHRGTKYIAATVGAMIGSSYEYLSKVGKDGFCYVSEWIIHLTELIVDIITTSVLRIKLGFEYIAIAFHKNVNVDCYMVLFLATTVFITVKVVLDYMNKRDLTLPLPGLRRETRIRLRRHHDVQVYVIDSSDEEVYAEDDFNEEEDTDDSEGLSMTSEDDDDIDDSGSVTHEEYEVASEEDSDDSLESEGGISVHIQLPPPGTYNLRTRKKSPSPSHLGGASSPNIDAEEELNRKCVVCQDQPKTVLVLPCKHMCLCVDCAHTIASSRNRIRRVCPLCRGRIQTVMNVFV